MPGPTLFGLSGCPACVDHLLKHLHSTRIPYTCAKFVVFEKVSEAVFAIKPKSSMSEAMQTTANLGSGLIAGFAAALISQPADTMLSRINKTKGLPGEGTTSRLIKIGKELGLRGSYTGIGTRLFMVGTLTAFQFAIYGKQPSPSPPFAALNTRAVELLMLTILQVTSRRLSEPPAVWRSANKRIDDIPDALMAVIDRGGRGSVRLCAGG